MRIPATVLTDRIDAPSGQTTISSIFLPFFVESILSNTIGFVSTLILSGYSDDAVGTIGIANQAITLITVTYSALGSGGAIAMSHSLGKNSQDDANMQANGLLLVSIVCGLIMGLLFSAFSIHILCLMNLEGDALLAANSYFRIVVGTSFLISAFSAISAIFRSNNFQKVSVAATILMNVINIILCYLVVYHPAIVPVRGITGIAAANVISRACALAVMIAFLFLGPIKFRIEKSLFGMGGQLRRILHYSIPAGILSLSYSASQAVTTSILVVLGMNVVTTKIYVSNIVHYVYLTGYSLAQAHALVVGWYVGAGRYDDVRSLNQRNQRLVWLLNGSLSLAIFLLGNVLMSAFTENPVIISMARPIMRLDILVEINRGTNHIQESFLRGAGDIHYPMLVSLVCEWCVVVPLVYLLSIPFGLGLTGCWIAFALDEAMRGWMLLRRVESRKWIHQII